MELMDDRRLLAQRPESNAPIEEVDKDRIRYFGWKESMSGIDGSIPVPLQFADLSTLGP